MARFILVNALDGRRAGEILDDAQGDAATILGLQALGGTLVLLPNAVAEVAAAQATAAYARGAGEDATGVMLGALALAAEADTLATVLARGNTTGGTSILLSLGDEVRGAVAPAAVADGIDATLRGGPGGSTSGAGGQANLLGGTPFEGNGGSVVALAENGVGADRSGGNALLGAGDATGAGFSGSVEVRAGRGGVTGTPGGGALLLAGDATGGDGSGGAATVRGGRGDGTGTDGSVVLDLQAGGTVKGKVEFQQDGVTFLDFDPGASVTATFGAEFGNITITQAARTIVDASGGTFLVQGQSGDGNGDGGVLRLRAGSGVGTGFGGNAEFGGGASENQDSGNVYVYTQTPASGNEIAGVIVLGDIDAFDTGSGHSTGAGSGTGGGTDILVIAGRGTVAGGAPGAVAITGGKSMSAAVAGGLATIDGGNGFGGGRGGDVQIQGGASAGGTGGSVRILVGIGTTRGNLALIDEADSYETMTKGIFVGNAVVAPTANPLSGMFLYVVGGEPEWRTSGGTRLRWRAAAATASAGVGTLPATPQEFLTITFNGSVRKIPLYLT